MPHISWHTELKSKLIGTLLILLPIAILALLADSLVQHFSLFTALGLTLMLLLSLLPFSIGAKLILYTSTMPISTDEIQKRVMHANKSKKAKYPAVIALCGVDGSGKTTQIKLIQNELKRNLDCKLLNLRWAAFLSYPFLAVLRVLGYSRREINIHGVKCINHYFYRNYAVTRIWSWLFTVDMMLRATLTLKVSLAKGYVVLCDRSPIDALVDLMAETGDYNLWRKRVGRLLLSIVPQNPVIVLLDIDEQKAYARKIDVLNIEYIRTRRTLFLDLAQKLDIPIIDASKTQSELYDDLVKLLSHRPFWFFRP